MLSKLSLPVRVRLMPIHIQRKYANGELHTTGPYGNSAMSRQLYGATTGWCGLAPQYCGPHY